MHGFLIRLSLVVLSLGLCAPRGHANAFVTAYTAGDGPSASTLVVDFGFTGGDAYAFTYRHDGGSVEDMLLGLAAAGDLVVDAQFFDFGGGPSIFVNGFAFDGNSEVPVFEGPLGESWSFFVATDGLPTVASWASANVGPTDSPLVDGGWYGFVENVSSFNSGGFTPTSNVPLPEPGSALAIAGLVGVRLLSRRGAA